MNRHAPFAVLLGALTLAVAGRAGADSGEKSFCSQKTLTGSYTLLNRGFLDGKPHVAAGTVSFDGEGRLALATTRSVEKRRLVTTGTYTVTGNCFASMKLATGSEFDLYFGPEGESFTLVSRSVHGPGGESAGENAVGGEGRRVSRELLVKAP